MEGSQGECVGREEGRGWSFVFVMEIWGVQVEGTEESM